MDAQITSSVDSKKKLGTDSKKDLGTESKIDQKTNPNPENQKKTYSYSFLEVGLTSLVVGLAETYFAAFAIELKLSVIKSGLLLSLPLILAAVWLYFSQYYSHSKFKSKDIRFIVKRSLFLQGFLLLVLSGLSFWAASSNLSFNNFFNIQDTEVSSTLFTQSSQSNPYQSDNLLYYSLMILFSIYWLGHFTVLPLWNRWMTDVLDEKDTDWFFSKRIRITQIGILIGLFLGGALLHLNLLDISALHLFTILFFICALVKFFNIYLFHLHPKPTSTLNLKSETLKKIFIKNSTFFIRYFIFNFSVHISAPFVAGYLLSVRNLSYFEFMIVMAGLFIGKIITTYFLQKFEKFKNDPYVLLIWGGLIAAPLPILWPIAVTVNLMFFVHFITGISWAAWELGLSLYFFKKTSPHQKVEIISLFHYVAITSQVLGALTGAYIFRTYLNRDFDLLFIVAGVVRALSILGLRKPRITS